MSHFSVLVITKHEPTDDLLQNTLMPWHEYECTGFEEYLQDVDETEAVLKHFNEPQRVVILADGSVHSRWSDQFYTGLDEDKVFPQKEFELPAGAREEEMTAEEARKHGVGYATEEDAAESWCGAKRGEDGRFYKRTNPNKKWDWWVRGGRYQGRLLTKARAFAFVGEPGAFDNNPLNEGGVDSCQVKALNLRTMQDKAEARAATAYDAVHKIIKGRDVVTFAVVRERHGDNIDAAREEYHNQPVIKDLQNCRHVNWFDGPAEFLVPREDYLASARKRALTSFAVVKDGQWYERGGMGWWGIVHDEKDRDKWDEEFSSLVEGLDPNDWMTVVDCHI